jgi:hypothetical protein
MKRTASFIHQGFKKLNNDASSRFTSLDFMKLFNRDGDRFSTLYTEKIYVPVML